MTGAPFLWNNRLYGCRYSPEKIRRALSDRPRRGRTKIDRELLYKEKSWCDDKAFTSFELCDYLENISKILLGMRQTRRYSKKCGNSNKKTSPLHIKRTPVKSMKNRRRITLDIPKVQKLVTAAMVKPRQHPIIHIKFTLVL